MKFKDRVKAAAAAFRAKSTTEEQLTLSQLLTALGVHAEGAAQSEATYYACCKVLSESIGKLPLHLQQYTPDSGIRRAREHRYYRMLNERPNRFMTASVFWGMMELCRNHYGNAYAWIDTTDAKHPQLWPLDPEKVTVWYDNGRLLKDVPDVYYRLSTRQGEITLGSEDVLHFKSHHTLDGLVGISVREQLASTIQGNAKAQQMLNKLLDSGMTAKAVLKYTGDLDEEKKKTLLKGLEVYAKGGLKDTGIENFIPLPLGMDLVPLNMKLADSQFLELRQYSALQIASAFGVKPYQIGDYTKSSYASAEAQQLSFLTDTLLFILAGYEQEIGYKLLSDDEAAGGYHAKFNTAVILRSDQKTQIDTLSAAVSNFLYTPNEAREKLDLPAKEGGDRLLGNGASIPVEYTGAQYTDLTREEEKAWLKKTITETLRSLLE